MMDSNFRGIGAEHISEDIPVDSKGHCLLCLAKPRPGDSSAEGGPSGVTSLHILSRYLGIDLKKLIMQNRQLPISSQLKRELLVEDKVGVGIKGLLCEDCASINKQFSEVFLQLEKIQMEMASSVKLIRWKLMEGDEAGQAVFRGKARKEEVELVEALREEAREKCSSKLNSLLPPAKIRGDAKVGPADPFTFKPKSHIDLKTGLINCGVCFKKSFKNEGDFLEHFKTCQEVGATPFRTQCMDCGEVFDDPVTERAHWRRNYGLLYECSACQDIFPDCALSKHQNFCCRVSPLESSRLECSCRLCGKGFISMAAFKSHLGSCHKDKSLPCNLCGKKFRLPSHLGHHRREVHGIINGVTVEQRRMASAAPPGEDHDMGERDVYDQRSPSPPPEPLEILPNLGTLGSTGVTGNADQPESIVNAKTGAHTCSICSREFSTDLKFREHFKSKHILTHYKCKQCGYTFDNRFSYIYHYRKAHQLIPFSCVKCNKVFPRRKQLRQHRLKEGECSAVSRLETDACSCRLCRRYCDSFRSFQIHLRKAHT